MVVGLTLAVAGWVLVQAARSRGFLWADDYTHLLISRSVIKDPRRILDVWGRPLMTATYIPASLIGEMAVRVTSLAMLALAAALCWRIAALQRMAIAPLAALLLLAQPITAEMGFAAAPGTVFSLVLALALWLRARGNMVQAALVVGLLPLARVEGIVVVGVWACFVALERRWHLLPPLGVASLAWAAVGGIINGDLLWILHANPYQLTGSPYGRAGWTFIALAWSRTYGPLIGALAVAGALVAPRQRRIETAILAALAAFYAVAWGVPLFSTIATPYYLVSAAVPVALVAHAAITALVDGRRVRGRALVVAAVVIGLALGQLRVSRSGSLLLAIAVLAAVLVAPYLRPIGAARRPLLYGALAAVVVTAFVQTDALPLNAMTLRGIALANSVRARGIHVAWTTDPSFAWNLREDGTGLAGSPPRVTDIRPGRYVVWDSHLGGTLDPAAMAREGVEVVEVVGPPDGNFTLLHRAAHG